jgi:glutamine cyclotransferase
MNKLQLHHAPRATSFVPRALAFVLVAFAFAAPARAESAAKTFLRYEIVATYPHDATAFTQGLALLNGRLVESRGLLGHSAITINTVKTGAVRLRRAVDAKYFAEGLALGGNRLVQLTWQAGLAFVYDAKLDKVGEFHYDGEGWGLASDGRRWFMSDGSDRIFVRRLEDFGIDRELQVTDGGRPVTQLNELEYAQGRLYANVWHSDRVAVIRPATGAVESWIDFAALRRGFAKPRAWDENENVLNGIAFDPASGHFYLTGKCWPVLYEVRLLPDAAPGTP